MSQQRLLNFVLDVLEDLGIDYMLTGSWVSSIQGQPRSTHDLDLVVSLTEQAIAGLVEAFSDPDFHLSEFSMTEAIRRRTMFNLLDNRSGDKVDFWMLTDEAWDVMRFGRRIGVSIEGREVLVSTPEDTVLAKLRWSKVSGGSQRQFHDALHVCELQWEVLDRDYLQQWSQALGVDQEWRQIVESLGK